jgi:hypothetical protein
MVGRRAYGQAARSPGALQGEALEVGAKAVGQVGARQRELHGGLQEAQLLPGVVPLALELDGIDGSTAPEGAEAAGQLDLAPGIRRGIGQDREEIRGEDVAADDGQVRRGFARIRLLLSPGILAREAGEVKPSTGQGAIDTPHGGSRLTAPDGVGQESGLAASVTHLPLFFLRKLRQHGSLHGATGQVLGRTGAHDM